jgi:hypothetical protein
VIGYNPYYVGGAVIGGIVGIYLFSVLFRYALLGRSGTKLQAMWVVLLTGIVAIGFSAFGDGTDGFANRITNPPDMVQILSYSLSALLVAFFVWWRTDDTPPPPETPRKGGIVGRAIALVFVIPMVMIGIGNIGGSIYSVAVNGPAPGPGWGVSQAEMREIMLNGDMAPFWRVVNDRAAAEMDYVIDSMFAQEAKFSSQEEAMQIFNQELVNFRVSLSTYGPAMTDEQRKELLQSNLELLRQFEDRPSLCVEVAMTGGQTLSQSELLSAQDELNKLMIVMTDNLLEAKEAASAGASMPTPPSDEDYGQIVTELVEAGMTEGELQALINEDTSHPDFCSANIAFLEGAIAMGGSSGEAVRFEVSQQMLVAAP